MTLALKAQGRSRIPFIWFWPDGASACGMMTHDVEGQAGLDFCDELMDIDDSYGIKSAFQLIPEGREEAWRRTAARLRQRGFEVNLHDLNHDGQLFADKEEFLRRARRINDYAREFGCDGFRSGAMYREQGWFDAFEFSYDMSVPNAAHLEPQRGGCCTVMPYFVGDILELPLTTVQDYTLFHILNDYSTTLWKEQIRLISQHHGLVSVITHPDYLVGRREREVYVDLLRHLADLRERDGLWMALPGEINRWWRNRHQMTLVPSGDGWRIEGPDSHRARVAYATLDTWASAWSTKSAEAAGSPADSRCLVRLDDPLIILTFGSIDMSDRPCSVPRPGDAASRARGELVEAFRQAAPLRRVRRRSAGGSLRARVRGLLRHEVLRRRRQRHRCRPLRADGVGRRPRRRGRHRVAHVHRDGRGDQPGGRRRRSSSTSTRGRTA